MISYEKLPNNAKNDHFKLSQKPCSRFFIYIIRDLMELFKHLSNHFEFRLSFHNKFDRNFPPKYETKIEHFFIFSSTSYTVRILYSGKQQWRNTTLVRRYTDYADGDLILYSLRLFYGFTHSWLYMYNII